MSNSNLPPSHALRPPEPKRSFVAMKLFDFSHPMFRPLWVRVLLVGICAGWSLFEFLSGSTLWAFLFAAMGVIAFNGLFLAPGAGAGGKPDKPGK